jgi:lipoate---protein ligase
MQLLDLTLPTPEENLALDEALLEAAEAGELNGEVLRLWESGRSMVVAGRSSRIADELQVIACQTAGIPILRRSSGGAAIVAGPGCLMYGVVLRYAGREHLRLLDQAHEYVLGRIRSMLEPLVPGIHQAGISDLAIGGKKFSGNSLRCKRDYLLYHGTLLYSFDAGLIERLLKVPPRQPAYRAHRPHSDFVTNISLSVTALRQALIAAFEAKEPLLDYPIDRTKQLVADRYSQPTWNLEASL